VTNELSKRRGSRYPKNTKQLARKIKNIIEGLPPIEFAFIETEDHYPFSAFFCPRGGYSAVKKFFTKEDRPFGSYYPVDVSNSCYNGFASCLVANRDTGFLSSLLLWLVLEEAYISNFSGFDARDFMRDQTGLDTRMLTSFVHHKCNHFAPNYKNNIRSLQDYHFCQGIKADDLCSVLSLAPLAIKAFRESLVVISLEKRSSVMKHEENEASLLKKQNTIKTDDEKLSEMFLDLSDEIF
jgi:hypothetical protein